MGSPWAPAPIPSDGFPGPGRRAPTWAYVLATAVTVAAVYSQYVVAIRLPALGSVGNFVLSLLVVYGIPAAAFWVLVGVRPLSRFGANGGKAAVEGIRWYGLMGLLTVAVLFVLVIVYTAIAPNALTQLSKPNPVLVAAQQDVWFWVVFSFVIGFVEETLFRGWVFGYWLARGTPRWGVHAIWTSLLFAFVHLYYGTTYGSAATFAFAQLFLAGLGFALAYRASGGNLVAIALLHGANDAIAFYSIVSPSISAGLHWLLLGVGGLVALALYLQSRRRDEPARVPGPSPGAIPYYWIPPSERPSSPAAGLPTADPLPPPPPDPPPGE
ncbi:MAG TPA: type II CAAX endopeptidase family protein [Thermoplasmata archaeon]|nr:type II CAAX endopeptidase family protein [Thermoplasmata archaeon]